MTSRCQCWFSLRNKIFRDFRRSQNWGSLQRFLVFATHPHCTYTGKHTFNEPTWTNQTNRPTRMSKKKHGKTTVSSQVLKVFPTRIRIFTSPTNLPNNQKTGENVKKHGESVFKKTREPPGYIFTSNSRIDTRVFGILQSNYPMSSIPWTEWLKEKTSCDSYLTAWYIFLGGGLETSRWHFYVFLEGWLRSNQEFHLSSSDTQWFWFHSLGHGTIPSSKSLDNMYKYTLIEGSLEV